MEPISIWSGYCPGCENHFHIADSALRPVYPQYAELFDTGEITAPCPDCGNAMDLHITTAFVDPEQIFDSCATCGSRHPPEWPHDLGSPSYEAVFAAIARMQGQPVRKPTLEDAWAHCTPEVRAGWLESILKLDTKPDN